MAITFGSSNEIVGSTSNPATISTTTSSTSEILVVTITTTGSTSRTGGAPTYDSVEMIQAGTVESSTEGKVELWYLLNDDILNGSAANISVPNSGTLEISVVTSWYNLTAGSSAIFYATAQANGTSTTPSVNVSVPSSITFLAVDGLFSGADSLLGWTSDRTLLQNGDTGAETYGGSYAITSTFGSTATMSYTTASDDWAIIAISFLEVSDFDLDTVNDVDYFAGRVASINDVDEYNIDSINDILTNL